MRVWFDENKDKLEIHALSVGSGLDNLLKDEKREEGLKKYYASSSNNNYPSRGREYTFMNPEDANTIE